jgi:lysyl-tRNA synthetase class II
MQELNDDLNQKSKYIQQLENKLEEKTKELTDLNHNFLRCLVYFIFQK